MRRPAVRPPLPVHFVRTGPLTLLRPPPSIGHVARDAVSIPARSLILTMTTHTRQRLSSLILAFLLVLALCGMAALQSGCTLGRLGKPLEATARDHEIRPGKASVTHPDGTEQSLEQSGSPGEASTQEFEHITETATPRWAPHAMPAHWSSYLPAGAPATGMRLQPPPAGSGVPEPAVAVLPAVPLFPDWSQAGAQPAYEFRREVRRSGTTVGQSQWLDDILDKLGLDKMGALYMAIGVGVLIVAFLQYRKGWRFVSMISGTGGVLGIVGALLGWGAWALAPCIGLLVLSGFVMLLILYVEKTAEAGALASMMSGNPALAAAIKLFAPSTPQNPPAQPPAP